MKVSREVVRFKSKRSVKMLIEIEMKRGRNLLLRPPRAFNLPPTTASLWLSSVPSALLTASSPLPQMLCCFSNKNLLRVFASDLLGGESEFKRNNNRCVASGKVSGVA